MNPILPARAVLATAATVLVGVAATASCERSRKSPGTASEEQQRLEAQSSPPTTPPVAAEQTPRTYGSMEPSESGSSEETPADPSQGRYRGSASGTMVEPGPSNETASPTVPPPAAQSEARGDVHQLTLARCQRELRCDNIGKSRKYDSTEQCIQKIDAKGYSDLGPSECKTGIRNDKMETCLSAIRNEECNAPLDSLKRLMACRSSVLCAD